MNLVIKQVLQSDNELIQNIKLLAAQKSLMSVKRFEFGKYKHEAYWVLLTQEEPVYFSHSHLMDIDGVTYCRIASKAAQLGNQLKLFNETRLPGFVRSGEIYTMLHHQMEWCRDYPYIITANKEKNLDSPASHRVFNLCKSGKFFGVNPNYTLHTINKTTQGVFFVNKEKIDCAYSWILKNNDISRQ